MRKSAVKVLLSHELEKTVGLLYYATSVYSVCFFLEVFAERL